MNYSPIPENDYNPNWDVTKEERIEEIKADIAEIRRVIDEEFLSQDDIDLMLWQLEELEFDLSITEGEDDYD